MDKHWPQQPGLNPKLLEIVLSGSKDGVSRLFVAFGIGEGARIETFLIFKLRKASMQHIIKLLRIHCMDNVVRILKSPGPTEGRSRSVNRVAGRPSPIVPIVV